MKIELEGEDWSKIKQEKHENIILKKPEDENDNNKIYAEDFFAPDTSPFGPKNSSPFNLGIYIYMQPDDKRCLKATKYVGVMPMMNRKSRKDVKGTNDEQSIIKINSRFGISPTEMLKEVLAGNDYYDNPEMLKTKSYSKNEWNNLKTEKDDKILFGVINGIGEIDLFNKNGEYQDTNQADVGLVNTYGVFEIIDFVDKAKKVCKKNLKKQSHKVEENLNCKVKGRILIQKQVKYNTAKGQDQRVYCSYNKMTENIKENQIIKYALYLCQHCEIGDSLIEDIRFCMNTLKNVPLKKCSVADFIGLKNNGAFKQYKDALYAAKKIIKRYYISYSENQEKEGAETSQLSSGKVLPYFINMNLLFEYYCRAIFRKAVDEYNKNPENTIKFELESATRAKRVLFYVTDPYWKKYIDTNIKDEDVEEDKSKDLETETLQNFFMASYIPDIVVTYGEDKDKVAVVFDAKYSDVKIREKRSRTHQIMFYMKALGCEHGGIISPYMGKEAKIPEDGICNSISVNHRKDQGKVENSIDGVPKLFYIPVIGKKGAENIASKQIQKCLENIAGNLEKDKEIKEITKFIQKNFEINSFQKVREKLEELKKELK